MMSESFKDHFSGCASAYAAHRPRYPDALFAHLAAVAPRRETAWDCGAGNGQASEALAASFAHVHATDASASQIAGARPHERITYRVARAEASGLERASVDLVAAAQAAHWFDHDAFHAEARRVGRPDAVIAVWCYGLQEVDERVDAVVGRLYNEIIGPYWPAERRYIDDAYATLPFPFAPIDVPALEMSETWTLHDVLAYLSTWSAVRRAEQATGRNPLDAVRDDLHAAWGEPSTRRTVRWPLHARIGRVHEAA